MCKICNEVTYDWSMYCVLVDSLMGRLVQDLKAEAMRGQRAESEEVELEIDNSFFKQKFVPLVHQTLMSAMSIQSLPLFNFVLSLRLAQTYKSITPAENAFILKQFMDLHGWRQWRDPEHDFVKLSD